MLVFIILKNYRIKIMDYHLLTIKKFVFYYILIILLYYIKSTMYTSHPHFLSTHFSHFSGKKVRSHSGEKNQKLNCATKIKKSTFFQNIVSKKIKKSEKKTSTNVTPCSEKNINKNLCSKNLVYAHFTSFLTKFNSIGEGLSNGDNGEKQNELNDTFIDPILARFQSEEVIRKKFLVYSVLCFGGKLKNLIGFFLYFFIFFFIFLLQPLNYKYIFI